MESSPCRIWLLAIGVLWLTGCGPIHFTIGGDPEDQALRAKVVQADPGARDRVAIIDVAGLIYNASKPQLLRKGENPVGLLQEKLEAARTDRRVKAVILRLNTPGGTVTASDAMFREVQRFRQRSGKPVVALMMDVTASGGYYLSCSADHLVAYPTAVTGSIGVILQTISFKPALDRWGVMAEAITSGKNKDAGSPLSTLSDDHRRVLRALVDDFYDRFVAVVRQARPDIPPERFADVTDGRVLSGAQAKELGLVDEVGDIHDALSAAKRLAGLSRAELVIYHRPLQYVGSPYAAAPATSGGGTQINIAQLNLGDVMGDAMIPAAGGSVGFFYLWLPEGSW